MSDFSQPPPGSGLATPLVYLLAAAAIAVRLGYRELRPRRMRLSRIFAVPALVAALAVFVIAASASAATESSLALALAILAGVVAGAAAGYASAHFTTVHIPEDPAARALGEISTRGSYATIAIWVGALALRFAARTFTSHDRGTMTVTDAAILALLASSLCVQRIRIFLTARRAIAMGLAATIEAA